MKSFKTALAKYKLLKLSVCLRQLRCASLWRLSMTKETASKNWSTNWSTSKTNCRFVSISNRFTPANKGPNSTLKFDVNYSLSPSEARGCGFDPRRAYQFKTKAFSPASSKITSFFLTSSSIPVSEWLQSSVVKSIRLGCRRFLLGNGD